MTVDFHYCLTIVIKVKYISRLKDVDFRKAVRIQKVYCAWCYTQFAGRLSSLYRVIIILQKRIIFLDTIDGSLFILISVSWRGQAKMFFFSNWRHWVWNSKLAGTYILMVNSSKLPIIYVYAKHLILGFAHWCGNVQVMKSYITKDNSKCNGAEIFYKCSRLVKWSHSK